ncbi:hypothetical protein ACFE04_020524 [Oxalis oulophora]
MEAEQKLEDYTASMTMEARCWDIWLSQAETLENKGLTYARPSLASLAKAFSKSTPITEGTSLTMKARCWGIRLSQAETLENKGLTYARPSLASLAKAFSKSTPITEGS